MATVMRKKATKSPAERVLELVAEFRELRRLTGCGATFRDVGPEQAVRLDAMLARRAEIKRELIPLLVESGGVVDLGYGDVLALADWGGGVSADFVPADAPRNWGVKWSREAVARQARKLAAELAGKAVAS